MKNVAILLTTFNGEKFLEAQLNSLLAQKTSFEFEVIVSDDGSTDSTLEILKKYNLSYTKGPGKKAADNFLSLLKQNPDYDFYAFCDQDDIWDENKLQIAYDSIQEINGPGLYVGSVRTNKGSSKHGIFEFPRALMRNSAQGCTMMMNKSLRKTVLEFLPEKIVMHDWFTLLVAVAAGEVTLDKIPRMYYRLHGNNDTGIPGINKKITREIKSIFDKEVSQKIVSQASALRKIHNLQNIKKSEIDSWLIGVQGNISKRIKYVIKNKTSANVSERIYFSAKIILGYYRNDS